MACLPCLVLDHDDTVVASTPTIHYPAFLDAMKLLRPEVNWSLHEYVLYNFEPGFEAICRDMLHLTDEEMLVEQKVWKQWTSTHVPPMFPGMAELLRRYREAGGTICVASHSSEEMIRRDYRVHCGFEPELVFGWDLPPQKRKPAPYALEEIMRHYGLAPDQLLMVDDLKPGWQMAQSCGVPFAFAGWGCEVEPVRNFMKKHSTHPLDTVDQLALLLGL